MSRINLDPSLRAESSTSFLPVPGAVRGRTRWGVVSALIITTTLLLACSGTGGAVGREKPGLAAARTSVVSATKTIPEILVEMEQLAPECVIPKGGTDDELNALIAKRVTHNELPLQSGTESTTRILALRAARKEDLGKEANIISGFPAQQERTGRLAQLYRRFSRSEKAAYDLEIDLQLKRELGYLAYCDQVRDYTLTFRQ